VDYIRVAQDFAELNLNGFYMERASELIEIEPFIEGKSDLERIEIIYNLCQKHSAQVEHALQRMRKLYDKPLSRIKQNSFFKLIDTRAYQKKEKGMEEKAEKKEVEKTVDLNKRNKLTNDELVKHYIQVCKDLKFN